MFHLGILQPERFLFSPGEKVARDIMYNGNVDFEQGAVDHQNFGNVSSFWAF